MDLAKKFIDRQFGKEKKEVIYIYLNICSKSYSKNEINKFRYQLLLLEQWQIYQINKSTLSLLCIGQTERKVLF